MGAMSPHLVDFHLYQIWCSSLLNQTMALLQYSTFHLWSYVKPCEQLTHCNCLNTTNCTPICHANSATVANHLLYCNTAVRSHLVTGQAPPSQHFWYGRWE